MFLLISLVKEESWLEGVMVARWGHLTRSTSTVSNMTSQLYINYTYTLTVTLRHYFNINIKRWDEVGKLTIGRQGAALAVLPHPTTILMMGGMSEDQNCLDSCEEWTHNTWIMSEMSLEQGRSFTAKTYVPQSFLSECS